MTRIPSHRPLQGTPTSAPRAGQSSPRGASATHETPPASMGSPLRTPSAFEQRGGSEGDPGVTSPTPMSPRDRLVARADRPPPLVRRQALVFHEDLSTSARASRMPSLPDCSFEDGFSTPPSNFSQPGRFSNLPLPRYLPRLGRPLGAAAQGLNAQGAADRSGLALLAQAASQLALDQQASSAVSTQQSQQSLVRLAPRLPLLSSPDADSHQAAEQGRWCLAPRPTGLPDSQG